MHEGRVLLEVAREKMRTRHFAYRTEQIYLHWIRRYVNFHDRRHPRGLGHEGVEKFLSQLAVYAKVSTCFPPTPIVRMSIRAVRRSRHHALHARPRKGRNGGEKSPGPTYYP
jgi:hypothetical protein